MSPAKRREIVSLYSTGEGVSGISDAGVSSIISSSLTWTSVSTLVLPHENKSREAKRG